MKRPLSAIAEKLSLITILCVALGGSAWAADEDVAKVERLYAEGATLFNSGRYEDALAKFNDAYETYPAANLLFNIARCHEALGKVELALEAFRRFVSQPGVDPNTKALAERKIKDLAAAKKQGKARRRQAAPEDNKQVPPPPPSEPLNFSPWHYVAMGAGVALAGGGVAAFMLGKKDQDDLDERRQQNPQPTVQEVRDLTDSADQKKLIGYILMGAGGAALLTGAVLLVLELTSGGESESDTAEAVKPSLAFGFSPLPGGGAASIGGRF